MDNLQIMLKGLMIVSFFYFADAKCEKRLFGEGCRFRCHCKNDIQCDFITGECPSECDQNWAGPGCQYRNIAVDYVFTEHTDEKTSSGSRLAIDGDISTCTTVDQGRTKPWWRIWLSNNYTITELEIVINKSQFEYFKEFKITVEHVPKYLAVQTSFNDYILPKQEICYENNALLRNNIINIVCKKPIVGNQVRLQLMGRATKLSICDFRILQGRNVAFHRRTTQSSVPTEEAGLGPSIAVDGSATATNCTKTDNEERPWWSVDLANIIVINRVNISTFPNAISGYKLLVSNDSQNWLQVYKDEHRKTNISIDVIARFVRVEYEKKQLVLCEVQILGDCLPNVCGFDCADPCHCKTFNSKIKMSGNCTSGCIENWAGDDSKCDRVSPIEGPSGIYMSTIAFSFSVLGVVALSAAVTVFITVCILKRRKASSSNSRSSQDQTERRPRPRHLTRLRERILSIYYNTSLRPKSNDNTTYDDLELTARNKTQSKYVDGYTDLKNKMRKLGNVKV